MNGSPQLPHLVIAATGEDERAIEGYVVDHGLERLVTRSDAGVLQGALAARGLRREIAVTTPHFLAALAAVKPVGYRGAAAAPSRHLVCRPLSPRPVRAAV